MGRAIARRILRWANLQLPRMLTCARLVYGHSQEDSAGQADTHLQENDWHRLVMEIGKLKSGFISALGGVNSGVGAELLNPNELSWAVNVRLRGGFPNNRPGFKPRALTFPTTEVAAWWANKVWQGAWEYHHRTQDNFWLVTIGGRVFTCTFGGVIAEVTPVKSTTIASDQISPGAGLSVTWEVANAQGILVGFPVIIGDGRYQVTAVNNAILSLTNLTATPGVAVITGTPVIYLDTNNPNLPQVWYEQAEEFMVIQDDQSTAIIFNGSTCRRSGVDEIPVGKMMKYHRGRIWLAQDGGRLIPGDIVGLTDSASVLKFTEYRVITGGGGFRVNGEITAMVEVPALDASLGQGPLQVITADTFNSFNLPTNRELWNTLSVPFQTVSLKDSGALGHYGCVVINGDVYFPSPSGWRSFVMARREFGASWSNTPISNEMDRILAAEVQELRRFASAVLFDNRFLFTVTPHRQPYGAWWEGIGSLDFHPISGMAKHGNPIYDGLWNGIHIYQLTTINSGNQCFAFTKEDDGIGLWEITKDSPFDGDGGRIPSFIELPIAAFADPFNYKKLVSGHAWIANLVGNVDYTMRFRPDDAQCWIEWQTRNRCAKGAANVSADGCALRTFKAGYKPHMGFGSPPETCAEFERKSARFAYQWQFRLEWVGRSTIKRLLFTADGNQDRPIEDCE